MMTEMEESGGVVGDSGGGSQWCWGAASATQIGLGLRYYAKGYAGDSRHMPFKAFAVASLFVGGAASATAVLLQANGIRRVEDLMEAGANLRAKLGLPPRTQNKNMDDS
ncbi:uncharacterized protein LOC113850017 [Abrus precatorius]|uniref:Uncharacterized protein LOC113850017 n=1 Tax=Abrus precatorius TaxID=3816 RepID=A0A8B8JXL9_ABRPR|nr:uncharacterized protein LOC113850017 [Abrus precatorius]